LLAAKPRPGLSAATLASAALAKTFSVSGVMSSDPRKQRNRRQPARKVPFERRLRWNVSAVDGFLAAVRLRLEAWRPLLEGPAWLELLLPILVHTPDPAIEARIARLPAEAKHHLAKAYRHIPTAVAALREHFLPARLVAAATSSRIH
jgi:hypothetical protein